MSHLHIPDGVLPLWIVVAGWLTTVGLLVVVVRRLRPEEIANRLPLLGVTGALMLIGMTVEVAPIAYHLNMSVVAGILLGPTLGFLAAFVVDLILALFGHGGITVVGLNTLVIGTEVALGSLLFRGWQRLLRGSRPGLAAALATLLTLFTSTLLMIGIVAASNVDPLWQSPNPEAGPTDIRTFAALVLGLGAVGWTIEALLNALIVGYVARVRPDLLANGGLAQERER